MSVFYNSMAKIQHSEILDSCDLGSTDCAIEGGPSVCWSFSGVLKSDFTIVVRDYDQSRHGEYDNAYFKPHIMIKSMADCSFGGNCLVKNTAGDTIYTFTENNLPPNQPSYCVLRLDTARSWELA